MDPIEIAKKYSELDGQERNEFLNEVKRDFPEAFNEFANIVNKNSDVAVTSLIEKSYVSATSSLDGRLDNLEGTMVGQYKLTRLINRGGMGVVYQGEREDIEQVVAIKLISPQIAGLMGKEKLIYEARALARVNHNNIATVHDFGEFEDTFYIATEYIEGTDLASYVKESNLNRLELCNIFSVVCDAIAHVHQNRIVHADIKPSNILVNSEGHIKVIDFGVAVDELVVENKDLDSIKTNYLKGLSEKYAAPEQLVGGVISTLSDVFSIGIMFGELVRAITHSDTELNSIFNKCCATAPTERYQSISFLKTDIQRIRKNRPVSVLNSFPYRFKLFAKRNFINLTVFGFIAITFSLFLTSWLKEKANTAQAEASALAVAQYVDSILKLDDPVLRDDPDITMKEVIEYKLANLSTDFKDESLSLARVLDSMGEVLTTLNENEKARATLEKALALKIELGDTKESVAGTKALLGESIDEYSPKEAIKLFEDAYRVTRKVDYLLSKTAVLANTGEDAQALEIAKNTLVSADNVSGGLLYSELELALLNLEIAASISSLAVIDNDETMRAEAAKYLYQAEQIAPRVSPEAEFRLLGKIGEVQNLLPDQRKLAERSVRRQLEILEEYFPNATTTMARLYSNLATILQNLNDSSLLGELINFEKKALELLSVRVKPPHIGYGFINIGLGRKYNQIKDYRNSIKHYRVGLNSHIHFRGDEDYVVNRVRIDMARAHVKLNEFDQAEILFKTAIENMRKAGNERDIKIMEPIISG